MFDGIDALRVAQDPAYAASLTDEQWRRLALDPAWDELVGEFHELVEPVIARYGEKLGIPAPREVAAAGCCPARSHQPRC